MIISGITAFIVLNIWIIFRYYKRNIEIFSPCMIIGIMSLTQLLPQLTTIYFHPHYDNAILYNLLFVMLSCNIALVVGYEKGIRSVIPTKTIWDFNIAKMDMPIFVLSLLGTIASFIFAGKISNMDWVIASQFQSLGIIGLSLALVKAYKGYRSKSLYLSLIMATIPLAYFAFFIKGSRNNAFLLLVMWLLFWSLKDQKNRRVIAKCFLGMFLIGGIASLSIVEIRNDVVHGDSGIEAIGKIDFIDNFRNAFTNSYTEVGMDLGNAAEGIEHCYEKSEYNYGLFLWNGFVYNYVPRRIVGEDLKNALMSDLQDLTVVERLSNGVTCMTGYYDAFSAFSYLGFIFYLIIGYFYGRCFKLAQYSSFYLFLYIFLLNSSAIIMTHGIQLLVARIEFLFVLVLPFLFRYIRHISIKRIMFKY